MSMARFMPALAASLLPSLLLVATPAVAGAEIADWFGLSEEVVQHWSAALNDPDTVSIRHHEPAAPGEQSRVMVLYSKKSSAYDTAMSKILSVFEDKRTAAAFTVVNYRNDAEVGKRVLARAREAGYDLVFTMGSAATAFAYKEFRGAAIPVVSVCAKDPVLLGQVGDYASGSGSNFAFTSLNVPVAAQLTYIRELRPNLRNIAVLFAHENKSAVTTQLRPVAAMARASGVEVLEVGVEDRRRAKQELAELVPDAVRRMRATDPGLRHSIFWITGSTSVFAEIATINRCPTWCGPAATAPCCRSGSASRATPTSPPSTASRS
jgi:putative ABC transport system substrate-binding protein